MALVAAKSVPPIELVFRQLVLKVFDETAFMVDLQARFFGGEDRFHILKFEAFADFELLVQDFDRAFR